MRCTTRTLLVAACLTAQSCSCGFEPVEEDAGPGAGLNAGMDAGMDTDAGSVDPCLSELHALMPSQGASLAHVIGSAGPAGAVDFIIGSYASGTSDEYGIYRGVTDHFVSVRVPASIEFVGLELWTGSSPVQSGVEYQPDNTTYRGAAPYLDVYVGPVVGYVSCQSQAQGRFRFVRFASPPSFATPVEGEFQLSCADAGLDVHGCFFFTD